MIRFACPGCSATFTVDDAKAGKQSKCPKCGAEFLIPSAEPAADDPPPLPRPSKAPTAVDPNEPVEIDPCPKCGTRVTVMPSDVGSDVECPSCATVFTAKKPGKKVPAPPPAPPKKTALESTDGDGRPRKSSRPRDDEDDEDDRPGKRRRRDDDDDDGDDDRPRRKKSGRRRRSNVESKRITAGILALLLGAYGVHKFYLGYTGAGVIQLVLTIVTCGLAGLVPFIEGIMYLVKTDEDFIETYQIGQKEWF